MEISNDFLYIDLFNKQSIKENNSLAINYKNKTITLQFKIFKEDRMIKFIQKFLCDVYTGYGIFKKYQL